MAIRTDLVHTLIDYYPIDAAHVFERYEVEEAWEQLRDFDLDEQVAVLEAFNEDYAVRFLRHLGENERYTLVRELPSDSLVNLLPFFTEAEQATLLADLPSLHADEVETLSLYPEETVGSVMSTEFTVLRDEATVADALRRLRRLELVGRSASYIYVEDDEERLVGVLLMRSLVFSSPATLLKDIMIKDVISVSVDSSLVDVGQVLSGRSLLAVPVISARGELVGVVSGTQLISELQEEGFEDAQKMFGAGSDEHATSSLWFTIRKRLPWLEVNLATAFLAAAVVGLFDNLIAEITILAAFLPVVAGQSGNAGAQALAVMLRSLAMDEVDTDKPRAVLFKESLVGLLNGLVTGLSAGLIAWLVSSNLVFGLVITLAMTINLMLAGLAGAGIPILMERLKQDPAQSSNIILTTITDVVGFATFLGLALLARPFLANLIQ